MTLNSPTFTHSDLLFLMSTSLMVAALRRGNTGTEILNILEALCQSDEQQSASVSATPTLEAIEF